MIVAFPDDVRARFDAVEEATGEPVAEQVFAALTLWSRLPPRALATLAEVQLRYRMPRHQALAVLVAAGAEDLTADAIRRHLERLYGNEGGRT